MGLTEADNVNLGWSQIELMYMREAARQRAPFPEPIESSVDGES